MLDHEHFMRQALAEAERAESLGEVPIGAVVVRGGEIIGRGCNSPISERDPTAHAEIRAMREAAQKSDNYRLPGCTLYVTIEPCTMCVGALVHARIDLLVFGAREPRAGAVVSQQALLDNTAYNHRVAFLEGICGEECGGRMQAFFKRRR